jgi:hypothetical protein
MEVPIQYRFPVNAIYRDQGIADEPAALPIPAIIVRRRGRKSGAGKGDSPLCDATVGMDHMFAPPLAIGGIALASISPPNSPGFVAIVWRAP